MNTYEVVETCVFALSLIMPLLTIAVLFALYREQRSSRGVVPPDSRITRLAGGPGALMGRREVDRCFVSVQTEGRGHSR